MIMLISSVKIWVGWEIKVARIKVIIYRHGVNACFTSASLLWTFSTDNRGFFFLFFLSLQGGVVLSNFFAPEWTENRDNLFYSISPSGKLHFQSVSTCEDGGDQVSCFTRKRIEQSLINFPSKFGNNFLDPCLERGFDHHRRRRCHPRSILPLSLGLSRQIAYDVLILALVHLLTIAPVTQRQLLLLAAGHSLGRLGYLGCWTKKYIVSN